MSYYNLDTYCDCLDIEVPTCYSEYIFQVQYTDVTGEIILTDKNNKKFVIETTTDSDGYFTLDATLMQEYLFNAYSKMKIEFRIDSSTYDYFVSEKGLFNCLYMNFYDITYLNKDREIETLVTQDVFVCCCGKKEINCDEIQ